MKARWVISTSYCLACNGSTRLFATLTWIKLHDNTGFEGVGIVGGAAAKLFESNRFVELTSGCVGFAHFEEDRAAQHVPKQLARDAAAPESGRDGEVKDFAFVLQKGAGDQEGDDATVKFGDEN